MFRIQRRLVGIPFGISQNGWNSSIFQFDPVLSPEINHFDDKMLHNVPHWSINTAHNHYAMSFRAAIVQFAYHTNLNTFRDNRDDCIGFLELAQREYDRCNLNMLLIKNPFDQIVFVLWRINRLRAQMRCAHCLLVSEQTVWISFSCKWNGRCFGKSRFSANISSLIYTKIQ